jgi:hypothetical protein
MKQHEIVPALYNRLLRLYPYPFRERLGESMVQTFYDLYRERRQAREPLIGFVLWTFLDTGIGIFREYLFLTGDKMKAMLKSLGLPALLGLLVLLPLIILELVNRRNFPEGFPFAIFFLLWFSLFALGCMVLPILQAWRTSEYDRARPGPIPGNVLLANARPAAWISLVLLLAPGVLPLLDAVGWLSVDRLVNGPNPAVPYLPGLFLFLGILVLPVAAGIISGGTIARTLRSGGSLFAHPIHLFIVTAISLLFAVSVFGIIADQWSCFMGVPNCD